MNMFWTTLSFLCALAVPAAGAAERCTLSPDETSFTKADGGRIDFVYGTHTLANYQAGTHMINQAIAAAPRDGAGIAAFAAKAAAENREGLDALTEQSRRISGLVGRGKVDWVALEGLPTTFSPAELEVWRTNVGKLSVYLQKCGLTATQGDQLIALSFTAPYWDVVRAAPWTEGVRVMGFDDQTLRREYAALEAQVNAELFKIDAANDAEFELISKVVDGIKSQRFTLAPAMVDALVAKVSVPARGPLKAALDLQLREVEVSQRREAFAADVLLATPGNGVVNMGSAHAAGLSRALRARCR